MSRQSRRLYSDEFLSMLVDESDYRKALAKELRGEDKVKVVYPCGHEYTVNVSDYNCLSTGKFKAHECRECSYITRGKKTADSHLSRYHVAPDWYIQDLAYEEDKKEARELGIKSSKGRGAGGKQIYEEKYFKCPNGHIVKQKVGLHINLSTMQPRYGCRMCVQGGYTSRAEGYVKTWLKDYDIKSNCRGVIESPSHNDMELDIYLPNEKFAIECDGEHYHQESDLSYNKWQLMNRGKDKTHVEKWKGYHQWKDDRCAEKGIKLIHVVSEDVIDFPEQTKAYILEELQKWKEETCQL